MDLTDEAATRQMVSRVIEQFSRIDVLANTVGGFRAGNPLHETPLETFDFMLALNARTAFILGGPWCRSCCGRGAARSSTAAPAGQQGARIRRLSASKAAVICLTEHGRELKASGINVNCILPHHRHAAESRGHAQRRFQ